MFLYFFSPTARLPARRYPLVNNPKHLSHLDYRRGWRQGRAAGPFVGGCVFSRSPEPRQQPGRFPRPTSSSSIFLVSSASSISVGVPWRSFQIPWGCVLGACARVCCELEGDLSAWWPVPELASPLASSATMAHPVRAGGAGTGGRGRAPTGGGAPRSPRRQRSSQERRHRRR